MKLDIDKSFFLSLHTHSLSSSTSSLGVLTPDLQTPFVSDTLVASDLVQSFNIFSQLGLEHVRCHLEVLAFLVILLSVEEPSGNTVSFGVSNDVGNTITLGFSELTGSEPGIDSEDFADEKTESPSNTLDFIKSIWNGSLTINISVKNTMNMLEGVVSVFDDE